MSGGVAGSLSFSSFLSFSKKEFQISFLDLSPNGVRILAITSGRITFRNFLFLYHFSFSGGNPGIFSGVAGVFSPVAVGCFSRVSFLNN